VIIGGSASIKDHTTLGSGAIIGAGSGVVSDVPAGKTVLSGCRSSRCTETMGYFKRLVNESKK
jgi:UDP-3-O-[3-hydroxymyristoyl] glucosamine N-acyltransferase